MSFLQKIFNETESKEGLAEEQEPIYNEDRFIQDIQEKLQLVRVLGLTIDVVNEAAACLNDVRRIMNFPKLILCILRDSLDIYNTIRSFMRRLEPVYS